MLYTILDDLIFYQTLRFVKKYKNFELKLYNFFYDKTNVYPKNVVTINEYIFYFVDDEHYFEAKMHLNSIRKKIPRKVALIRSENTLINLVLNLFPDIYIHDIRVEYNIYSGKREISINLLSYEERGIALGRNGNYIKTINLLFDKYILFQKEGSPVKISCEVVKLY